MNSINNNQSKITAYFPGKLLVIANELFEKQRVLCRTNDINSWKSYVDKYFHKDIKYCMIVNRDDVIWTFNSGFPTLPLVLKLKYDELMHFIGAFLYRTTEYITPDNQYLLCVNDFTIMEKYGDVTVTTVGVLKILFDQQFKILIYEFCSTHHDSSPNSDIALVNQIGVTPQYARMLMISEIICEMSPEIQEHISSFDLSLKG